MTDLKPWAFELEAYIREGEPDRARKAEVWQTAIGLQAVDGLEVSEYLIDTAKEHIEGKIDSLDARRRIDGYYEQRRSRGIAEEDIEEADKVSQRIAEILGEDTFQFSPAALMAIHKRLFTGIIKGAGEVRPYNITKKEWVLAGETVLYAPCELVWESLKYDFEQEASFSYADVSLAEAVAHIAKFASGIWQIHPFREGNTRTTAVFVIKYLSSKGLVVTNDEFKEHSWYFRNALVRANYTDFQKGVHATFRYLDRFFENLLLGAKHELKNRYLHVDYRQMANGEESQSASAAVPKCNTWGAGCTLDCTLDELAVLRLLAADGSLTQKALASQLGISERTVKTRTVRLQEKGLLRRDGGKRSGRWIVSDEVEAALQIKEKVSVSNDISKEDSHHDSAN
ncbi:Fic family protein [Adlercreutzia muris]|uniref:protein adenylyltransferase n=1 Tax=Adlercreutzia muris TaxID=1796610 RepID=A0A7C8BQE3_9ACTN|nr:Fic family protein [Adlercreutzia muris]KAB1644273.1 winged helix-turn-helix transcriptional regulator [Adlercreutzia muris]MCR2028510.1 Fic family protein [Adlercreutzia muris]MCU7584540.1 Fic family protein [Adlercreutzia muris]